MKRLLFTILALCVLCVGLQAQNTNTSNQKGVTSQGQLDTVRNTREHPTTQDEPIQSNFVDQFGTMGKRPGLSPYGQRLNAIIKLSGSVVTCSVSWNLADLTLNAIDSGDYVLPVIERGVCYGLEENPTLTMANVITVVDTTISGNGFGDYEVSLSGLHPATTYHARAYAVTLYDTVYGDDIPISTPARTYCTVTDAHTDSDTYNETAGGLETLKDESDNEILTVTDQDGNVYPVVQIGSQCWMAVNLRTKHFSDGTKITTSNTTSVNPRYYDYSSSNIPLVQRGYLYNWYATMKSTTTEGAQGICPTGWHVPTWDEYKTMIAAAGASYTTGAVYLSGSCMWKNLTSATDGMTPNSYNNPDRNNSGFSAVPAGYFDGYSNNNSSAGGMACFWSSTLNNSNARYCYIVYYNDNVYDIGRENKIFGHSVRCVRDITFDLAVMSGTVTEGNAYICGDSNIAVTYTATPNSVSEGYTYLWTIPEGGTATTVNAPTCTITYTTTGTKTVTCTVTGGGVSVVKNITTEVSTGLQPSFTMPYIRATVKLADIVNVDNIVWQEGGTPETVSGNLDTLTHTYPFENYYTLYTITATSEHNCKYSESFRTCDAEIPITPCTVSEVHTTGYTVGTETSAGTGGLETLKAGTTNQIDSVYDQNGYKYSVVQIGSQCWMAENLRATKYASNLSVTDQLTLSHPTICDNSCTYTYPNGNVNTVSYYGLLYNWYAAMATTSADVSNGSQGVCPKGWHVPSRAEFDTLLTNTGANNAAGKLIKSCNWRPENIEQNENDPKPGNHQYQFRNSSGFSALAAGCIYDNTTQGCRWHAFFWASTSSSETGKDYLLLVSNSEISAINNMGTQYLCHYFSVRCVRDVTLEMSSTAVDGYAFLDDVASVTVTYTATVSNGDSEGYTYQWADADGEIETDGNSNTLVVTYDAIGTYTVTCTATRNNVQLTNSITTRVTKQNWIEPLTFEAKTAGATVTFTVNANAAPNGVEYSTDGTTWAPYTGPITLANVSDKVSFRGNNATYATSTGDGNYSKFSCTNDCYVYGNVMSLIDSVDFATATELNSNHTFNSLFSGNDNIYNHETKPLILPATKLTANCYYRMFWNCKHLTKAPELPAMELADHCYAQMFLYCTALTEAPTLTATTMVNHCYFEMFDGCTQLTTAPALPATILAYECYMGMFKGCTSLTTAPSLPATTLADHCYYNMFYGCTHLTTAPSLPATILTNSCYHDMFNGCTSLTIAPALSATTLASSCYNSMFKGCTSLTTAPALPAMTLTNYCYGSMFSGCTQLNKVTCLATDISATNCTKDWLKNVAATGRFIKPESMNDWALNSPNGIPVGWTINGKLPGEFTINTGGGKVHFSQGNLQYQANSTGAASAPYTGVWKFAEHQYDMIGSDNANISDSYTGWIDLLGWGTGNAPTKSSTNNNDYSTFTDWGVNAISNGGNTADKWHTLTKDEWLYLFGMEANNTDKSGHARYRKYFRATVNGVQGIVVLPDDISDISDIPVESSRGTASTFDGKTYTTDAWFALEAKGCVFLPAAGYRNGESNDVDSYGHYWSSTPNGTSNAYRLGFGSGGVDPAFSIDRHYGFSVRLVYETPYFLGAGTEADPYLISSEADWNYLAVKVNSGTTYANKFFRQTANIEVTTMVGISDSRPFSGTYDGDGKTLNLNLNTTESHAAPFRYIVDATVKNVVTTGSVYSTSNHPSGLVGRTGGTCTVRNCRVGANVGGAQHSGGIVGHSGTSNISIIGCVYSGTLTPASGQKTGGLLGWGGDGGSHTMTITDCLFAGSLATSNTEFHPIGIVQNTDNTRTLSNSYYTLAVHNMSEEGGNSFVKGLSYKGKFARSITGGTGVTVAKAGTATAVYDVSGITSYGTGILYGGVLYAGDGEEISLTLSHAAAPTGFSFSQYTVTGGGTLSNPSSNNPTLTMTDADQVINAQWNQIITFTAPTLRTGLTFNGNQNNVSGSAQNLVNAGSVSHGTIYYSTNGGSSWSTSVPTGTNAGTYTVHYKVVPDAGYSGGVGSTSLGSTTIDKANGWCTLSPTNSSGWGSISFMDLKIESFTVTHHGGGLSHVKGGSQQDNISVGPNGNTYSLTCTSPNKISSAVTITVTSAATTNYNEASATYTCYP